MHAVKYVMSDGRPWAGMLLLIAAGCAGPAYRPAGALPPGGGADEAALGRAAFEALMADAPPSTDQDSVTRVERVGRRLVEAAGLSDMEWEFQVIDSPKRNAVCLPGGRVAVNDGLVRSCRDDAELAGILAHELAHVMLGHGAERMRQDYVVNGVGHALSRLTRSRELTQRDRLLNAHGVATKFGFVLPFSVTHELEADQAGLLLMAEAGYDPSAALRYWQRHAEPEEGVSLPELVGSHPVGPRRISELRAGLPDAMARFSRPAEESPVAEADADTPVGRPRMDALAPLVEADADGELAVPTRNPLR